MKENRFYRLIRNIAWFLCKIIFPTKVTGAENIPAEGPVLLCSNHVSMVDPVLLAVSFRRQVTFMAKKELFGTKFTNWFFTNLGMVPVDRGASDIQAMRVCLEVLNSGGLLGVFPQGHRFKQDESREIQNGAALMFVIFIVLLGLKVKIGNGVLRFMGAITLEFYLVHGLFVELFGFDFLEVVSSLKYIKNVPLYTLVVAACSLPVTLLVRKLLHPKQAFLPRVKG